MSPLLLPLPLPPRLVGYRQKGLNRAIQEDNLLPQLRLNGRLKKRSAQLCVCVWGGEPAITRNIRFRVDGVNG